VIVAPLQKYIEGWLKRAIIKIIEGPLKRLIPFREPQKYIYIKGASKIK
jgi:hypothetical protein